MVVSATDCPELKAESIVELVGLELHPRPVVLQDGTADEKPTRATLSCRDAGVVMRVADPTASEALTLELDLSQTPEAARSRLLALTLSELIVTSRMERPPQPAKAQSGAQEAPLEAEPEPPPSSRLQLWLGGGLARQGSPALIGPNLQLGGLLDFGSLGMLAELQADWGSQQLSAGEAQAWTASSSLAAAARFSLQPVEFFAAAGARAGYASLQGSSSEANIDGAQLSGLWAGPMLTAGLHLHLGARLALHTAVELMYIAKPIRGLDAAGARFYALQGTRLTVSAGLAFTPIP